MPLSMGIQFFGLEKKFFSPSIKTEHMPQVPKKKKRNKKKIQYVTYILLYISILILSTILIITLLYY
ncbi:hypothetical protein SAMN05421766_10959 [Zobellia uliginosa]|uniref:DUF3899 domain-containing protein n=1 Tax=Zobellia uliginosa TaxID=143224 RepID=A0ABY1L3D9_9FLAO|nr:hypothetical protein SAMN05421766_10959 [Zobellia uliginosa]